MEFLEYMKFIYVDVSAVLPDYITLYGPAFCGGFIIVSVLHLVGFAAFGIYELIYIDKE